MAGEFQGRERTMQQVGQGVESLIRQDQYGNIVVSQSLPPLADLVLNNKCFVASSAAGTNLAPIIAPPTTAATWLLYNPTASGKTVLVLRAWMVLESGTRAIGSSMWGAVTNSAEATAPTAYTSSRNTGWGHAGTPTSIFAGAVTLDATHTWACLAAVNTLADANESSAIVADLPSGIVVVPAGRSFAIAMHDSAAGTTPLYGGGFIYAELPLRYA